jgi:photosystem II stability/assembly factor-like uncharacterized protein
MKEITTDLRDLGQRLWPDDSVLHPVASEDRKPTRRRTVLMTAIVATATVALLVAILTAGLAVLGRPKAAAEPPANRPATIGGLDMLSASDGWGWNNDLIARTNDGALTFTDVTPRGLTSAKTVSTFTAVDLQHAWAVVELESSNPSPTSTYDAWLYRTSDGGATWKSAPINPYVLSVMFVDPLHGWELVPSTPKGQLDLMRSVDGGASWSLIYQTPDNVACEFAPTFLTPDFGFATVDGCGAPSMTITRDGGLSWQSVDLPIPAVGTSGRAIIGIGPVAFTSPSAGSVFLDVCTPGQESCHGAFYRTTDGGLTWSSTSTILGGGGFDVGVLPGGRFAWAPYSCLASCVISDTYPNDFLTTADGGHTWTSSLLPGGMQELGMPEDFAFVTPRIGFELNVYGEDVAGPGAFTYFRTIDAGKTWTQFYPRLRE